MCSKKMPKCRIFDRICTFLGVGSCPLVYWNSPTVYIYVPNFISISSFCCTRVAENPKFSHFGLWHFVVSPIGSERRKLNAGAQLQTFPHPTVSKLFLYSNAFKAESCTHIPLFTSVMAQAWWTVGHSDRQTRNCKHCRAAAKPAACANSLSGPNLACDTGPMVYAVMDMLWFVVCDILDDFSKQVGHVRAVAPCQVVMYNCVTRFHTNDISKHATGMFEDVS